MEFRRLLLRIMLWSLGIGAFLGATAILIDGSSIVWRVSTTTICTAIAAALMMAGSRMSEKKGGWIAGTLLMGIVIVEFFGSVILTWELHRIFLIGSNEYIFESMLALFVCGVAAVALLRTHGVPAAIIAVPAGLITTAGSFILLLIAIWLPQGHYWSTTTYSPSPYGHPYYQTRDHFFESGVSVGLIGLLLAGTLANPNRGARLLLRVVRSVGALAAVAAIAASLVGIWQDINTDTGVFRIPLSIACVVTLSNLCLLIPLKRGQDWLRWLTIAAGASTAFFINLHLSLPTQADMFERMSGASGIVAACGILGLVVLARLNKRMDEAPAVVSEVKALTVICPSCQTKQTVAVGGANCSHCRLVIFIRVEEPRCPHCDYLLYMCKSDRCPECGNPVTTPAPNAI